MIPNIKRKSRRSVAIISRESNSKTLDIRLLEKELQRRGIKVTTLCRLLTKEKSLRSLGYLGHIFKQIGTIASTDVVILDTYCIPVSMLPHHKDLKVIQMWHALSAVKQFGWQTVGKPDGSSERTANVMKMHKGYSYVICASDLTAKHFCEAFRVPENKIRKLGLPRIDYIKSVSAGDAAKETAEKIYAAYPRLRHDTAGTKGRKTILYAPTFHKGKPADVKGLAAALDADQYDLVVKLHPIDKAVGEKVTADNVIYDDSFRSYDWLSVADAVISDYSSLVVEATLADKPLYLYTYDIDTYKETTGLNIDLEKEPIAPYVFRDADQLAASLGSEYDMSALRAFRDRYIDIDTENCTAQLADFIESLMRA